MESFRPSFGENKGIEMPWPSPRAPISCAPMCKTIRHAGMLRLALIGATLAGFVLAFVLAASPELHERLHHEDGGKHHECLATALHAGACDDAAPAQALASFIATLCEAAPPGESRAADSLFLSFRILEHAPPRRA